MRVAAESAATTVLHSLARKHTAPGGIATGVHARTLPHAAAAAAIPSLPTTPHPCSPTPNRPHTQLDIAYDSFIRTTDARHESLVREVLERVGARGDIYAADYSGYYCVDCEEYKDEGEMDAGAWGRRCGG